MTRRGARRGAKNPGLDDDDDVVVVVVVVVKMA
jgi:hypothetical protein